MIHLSFLLFFLIHCSLGINVFYAENTPIESISSDSMSDMSSDEEVFAGLLNDDNRAVFAKMPSSKRQECLHMSELYNITGKSLSPDEIVEKVSSAMEDQE